MMLEQLKSSPIIHGAWLTIAMTPCALVAGFIVGTFCAVGGLHDRGPRPRDETPAGRGAQASDINPI